MKDAAAKMLIVLAIGMSLGFAIGSPGSNPKESTPTQLSYTEIQEKLYKRDDEVGDLKFKVSLLNSFVKNNCVCKDE